MLDQDRGYVHRKKRNIEDTFAYHPYHMMMDSTLSDGAYRLYGYMHWRYGANKDNHESQKSMGKTRGKTTRTIRAQQQELAANDWIIIIPRYNQQGKQISNFYHVFEDQADCVQWRKDHPQTRALPKPEKKGGRKKTSASKGRKKTSANPDSINPDSISKTSGTKTTAIVPEQETTPLDKKKISLLPNGHKLPTLPAAPSTDETDLLRKSKTMREIPKTVKPLAEQIRDLLIRFCYLPRYNMKWDDFTTAPSGVKSPIYSRAGKLFNDQVLPVWRDDCFTPDWLESWFIQYMKDHDFLDSIPDGKGKLALVILEGRQREQKRIDAPPDKSKDIAKRRAEHLRAAVKSKNNDA